MENKPLETDRQPTKHSTAIGLVVVIVIIVVGFLFFAESKYSVTKDSPLHTDDAEATKSYYISGEEREEIIRAMLEGDSVIRSGDMDTIRTRFSLVFPELTDRFEQEELEQMVKTYIQNMPEVTEERLRAEDVVWRRFSENRVSAVFVIDGREWGLDAFKVDGVWY